MRRQFQLSAEDETSLRGLEWEAVAEAGNGTANWLILSNYPVPDGYNVRQATVALQIPPGYPDTQIDMAYMHPPLTLASGRPISNLSPQQIDGRMFQRWSRHRTAANPWRPGFDSIGSHLLQVKDWLDRELRR